MTAFGIAAIVFVCTFGGALVGMRMRALLPAHHLGAESKEVIHLCMGLIATMTALILGLVTASAKGAYDAQEAALKGEAVDILALDRALTSYGAETSAVREEIRRALELAIADLWPGAAAGRVTYSGDARPGKAAERIQRAILELSPQSEQQRWLQSHALEIVSEALKTRWLSFAGAGAVVPPAFLAIIVFWLTVLFWSFGLFAPGNAMVIAILLLSALSVAASVFLILEMQSPFEGLMQLSPGPFQYALAQLAP